MTKTYQKPHAILFSYPLQGHVIPSVNLAIKLASNGFTITFVNTESIHHQISKSRLDKEGEGNDIFQEKRQEAIDYIPGVKAIKPTDLASYLQSSDTQFVVNRLIDKAFKDVKKAEFIICNTVQELELETITALQEKRPVYAIGPLFSPVFTESSVSTSLWSESDCTHWLDTKPRGSVLYISFGSYAHTSKENIMEIAYGLMSSEVNFIWVLRPDIVSSEETDYLPIGFKDRVKDQGLIVLWCTQTAVISHPAVGGFLTHCGWNSILESIWCSVPFICFPLLTDQFTNRKLVVDDWKIGINLCDGKSMTRDEVAAKVNYLMRGKSAEDMKQQIKKIRKALEDALARNGSSQVNFTRFVNDLKAKIPKKNEFEIESEDQQSNHSAI